jgi:hypothetical protein
MSEAAAADNKAEEAEEIEYEVIEPGEKIPVEHDDNDPRDEIDDDDDDNDEEEGRLGTGEDDADAGETQQRKREERRKRRERQKLARERQQRELAFTHSELRRRDTEIRELRQRMNQADLQGIQGKISEVDRQLKMANDVMSEALDAGRNKDFLEAQGIRDNLVNSRKTLEAKERELSDIVKAPEPARGGVDPRVIHHAEAFAEDHPWWNNQSKDKDSILVSQLDNQVIQDGYDPSTPAYWQELRRRVQANLPHRFEGGHDNTGSEGRGQQRQSRGPKFSSGGRERSLKPHQFQVSAERKQAMIDAGVWHDPKQRNALIKRYAEYDRENGRS